MQTVCIWQSRESLRRAAIRLESDLRKSERQLKLRKAGTYILTCCSFFCSGLLTAGIIAFMDIQSTAELAVLIGCAVCMAACGVFLLLQRSEEVRRPPAWYTRYRMDEKVFQYIQAGKPIVFSRGPDFGSGMPDREADYALIDFDQRQVFAMAESENGEIFYGTAELEDLRFNWLEDDLTDPDVTA